MPARSRSDEAGLTLMELMVVLVMAGILIAVAIPTLSRDQAKSDFEKLVGQLSADLQAARFQAISAKDWREINIQKPLASYYLNSVDPTTLVTALLRTQPFPANVEVAGFMSGAKDGAGVVTLCTGSPTVVRFSMTGALQINGPDLGNCPGVGSSCSGVNVCTCSFTIFLHTLDDRYRSRLVIYQSTGYSRRVENW